MISLRDIQASRSIVEDLACHFDFNLDRASRDNSWIKMEPPTKFTVLAGESCGGVFLGYGDDEIERLPILYATSEGQAGCLAAHLTELLGMMMAVPYWQDLLKFSGGGNLAEMRKAAEFMEREYVLDFPDLPAAKKRIMATLPIPAIPDPIQLLHERVSATDCSVVADDGWRYESLFNDFKTSDNPRWR
ncbi:hypothetical protein [Pseudoduganella sp. OTU4001]|uniref:hypothetical protein n=1 Tax=Pseudoduganella sp. OTU4001 TaxID=3043854 RepID=UPI00313E5EED